MGNTFLPQTVDCHTQYCIHANPNNHGLTCHFVAGCLAQVVETMVDEVQLSAHVDIGEATM